MNYIQIIKQTELLGQQFTVYGTVESPLFLAKDIAKWINHSDPSKMLNMVDADEKLNFFTALPKKNEVLKPLKSNTYSGANYNFLTEYGVYEVLMQSNLPIAKQFKKGVKSILKEIRKTGGYIATTSDDSPELIMARALQVAQATIEKHKQKIKEVESENEKMKTKAIYTDNVLQSESVYTSTQIAKELNLSSAKSLHNILKSKDIMFNQSGKWMLFASYSKLGYTKTKTMLIIVDGVKKTNTYTVWTEKGRLFLHSIFESEFKLERYESNRY